MLGLLGVVTICLPIWSLWVRRGTWAYAWERTTSGMVAMSLACFLLISPLGAWLVDPLLHAVTGKWGLCFYAGHMFGIGATASLVYMCVRRIRTKEWLERSFNHTVYAPMRVVMPVLFVLFCCSRAAHHQYSNFMALPEGPWLHSYWVTLGGFYIYLLGYALRALLTLRNREDLHPTIHVHIAAAISGIAAVIFGVATAFHQNQTLLWLFVLTTCLCAAGFAYGTATAWKKRLRWFTPQTPISV